MCVLHLNTLHTQSVSLFFEQSVLNYIFLLEFLTRIMPHIMSGMYIKYKVRDINLVLFEFFT